jgi:hypothetical protein
MIQRIHKGQRRTFVRVYGVIDPAQEMKRMEICCVRWDTSPIFAEMDKLLTLVERSLSGRLRADYPKTFTKKKSNL